MRISADMTDVAVLRELGERLARLRLQRNLTQQQLGDLAGISRHTVLRLEEGQPIKTGGLIRVLRALDMLDGLEVLVPPSAPSPIEEMERRSRPRRRASGARRATPPADGRPQPWRWRDETERHQ